jgi:hypothetical protein
MSNIDLPVPRKRLRRVVTLITAAAFSTSLIAATAGPANAAVREPAGTAAISLASSSGLPAVSLASAARYVYFSGGRLTLDTGDAERAGVRSQALSTESGLVASMNKLLDRRTAAASSARDGVAVDAAKVVPAAATDTTITVLPGITLTISSTGIQLSLTSEAVTEVENVLGFGQSVASLVGAILSVIPGQNGGPIASIVASSLGLGNSLLKLCTASDGSATFTITWPWLWPSLDLPSCSRISV